jgi:hypothetical protein
MVLVISTSPDLLIENLHQSPFNVGLRLNLQDFTLSQIAALNRRYREPLSERELTLLIKWLGGHPYLTRQAFYTLVTEGWRWDELMCVALSDEGPFGEHLQRYYWLLDGVRALKAGLRQVIRQQRCPDKRTFDRLRWAGLVTGSSKACTCRGELYEKYFYFSIL